VLVSTDTQDWRGGEKGGLGFPAKNEEEELL